jgi:hypothetical protein
MSHKSSLAPHLQKEKHGLMIRTLRYLSPLFAVLICSLPARAQHIDSPYRFLDASQHVGGYFAHVHGDAGSVGLGAESGSAYGARYGLRLSGPFMLDVDAMYFPTHGAVLDTVVVDSAFRRIGTASMPLVVATASLRFNFSGPRTWHRLQPFVSFGAGAAIGTQKDVGAIEAAPVDARYSFRASFAGSLGAGLEIYPTQRISIRLDGRNMLWKIKTPAALLRGTLGSTMPKDEWAANLTTSAGISIHF